MDDVERAIDDGTNTFKALTKVIAEVVESLTSSTAVREVVGSIPAEGMFSEKVSPS